MQILHSAPVRTLMTLVVAGCLEGRGSGLIGIANDSSAISASTTTRRLLFFTQPNTTVAGQIITPPVEVVATDTLGAPDPTFTSTVTVSLAVNTTGAVLGGTLAVRAIRGIATFSDLRIDRVGSYALRASAPGATPAISETFFITSPTAP